MEKKDGRGGRREGAGRKPTGLKRPERITFWATTEEKARISEMAKSEGLTLADFVRSKVFGTDSERKEKAQENAF